MSYCRIAASKQKVKQLMIEKNLLKHHFHGSEYTVLPSVRITIRVLKYLVILV